MRVDTTLKRCVASALLSASGQACSGSAEDAEALEGVVYRGAVTDEALARILDQTPTSGSVGISVLSPKDGAVLSATAPVEFRFEDSSVVDSPVQFLPSGDRYGKGSRDALGVGEQRGVLEWLGLVRVAHAHGEPFNGRGYYLSVVDDDQVRRLAVFTDGMRYAPSETEWAKLTSGVDPLELTIVWADFDDNDIPAGGGPFLEEPVRFELE